MRILFADSNHAILHESLIKAGFSCDLFWDRPVAELLELLPQYDILVLRSRFKISAEIIDRCPNLKCIARIGAGMENIDVPYAQSKGIACLCVPEGNRDAVGEHAIGMLLMLLNNLKKADSEVREGIWIRAENRGHEIKGKTVGIIGYGQMGSAFAEKLSGFGCKILAYDKYRKNYGNAVVSEVSMDQIFEETDILSLHIPLTEETRFLVNAAFLQKFKKPIYLLNTSRGKCLNTKDLLDAIDSGKVKGACLDVLEFESVSFETIPDSEVPAELKRLRVSDKVVLSPHIAGWTHESNYKMSLMMAEKIISLFKNQQ
ncbi:MAG: hydroxyacid dehydrogenase [Bacteroidia bacterium]|nr:hydroxyacid dehydrogenase [Bacteroidia bacterium]